MISGKDIAARLLCNDNTKPAILFDARDDSPNITFPRIFGMVCQAVY